MSAGNVAEAAKLAKRNRSDFYKLFKKHNIKLIKTAFLIWAVINVETKLR